MDWSLIWLAGLGLFLAGVVKGATGLGYFIMRVAVPCFAVGLKPAMALILVPAMATNVTVAFTTGHFVETARRFANLYIAMLPGIAVGVCLLVWIAQSVAVRTLGIIVMLYALMTLVRPRISDVPGGRARAANPTGFANGVLTGLTGSQVMPLFPYMMSLNLDPNRMVQAIDLAVSIASVFLAVGLFSAGIMTPGLMGASVLAILPALAGVEIGSRIRAHIPASQFRSVVLYVLLATGLLLLVRS